MDFARSGDSTALQSSTSPEHETKLFVTGGGGGGPFMASNNNNSIMQHQSQHHQNDHRYHHHAHDQMSYGMMMQPNTSSSSALNTTTNFISSKDGTGAGAYDLGELDQALFLYLDAQDPSSSVQDQRQNNLRPPTLNIFPSKPMHVGDSSSAKAMSTMGLVSPAASSGSKRSSEPSMDLSNANTTSTTDAPPSAGPPPAKAVKREGNGSVRKGLTSSSEHDGPKTPDPKTLRRLAQNREAARKSRLRKKAYVQLLETSRMKLTQLEQDLQRARAQGVSFVGGALVGAEQGLPLGMGNLSSGAAMFDMEYGRWLEEHHRMMCELRAVLQEQLRENELRLFVDNCLAHLDEMMNLKSMIAKTDVFHLVSGTWKTPAERCFMWMGGFRPSHLVKIILNQIEPLTEQQLLGVCQLQQSTQEAEDALSQGLEALNQSLLDIIVSDSLSCPPNTTNYMGQMAMAMNKLSTVEDFVRQADNLRHQTIHRLHQLLTTRQSARCLIAIAEYFHRLRALSSLWMARPRQD